MPDLRAFVHKGTPRSVNAVHGQFYVDAIRESFSFVYPHADPNSTDALYGIVYFFSARQLAIDADNLSKPIWDALRGLVFDDDRRVELRYAGVISANRTTRQDIRLNHVPGHAADMIIELLGGRENFIYIEIGKLNQNMYQFGLAGKYR